jgi:hypothetical protein
MKKRRANPLHNPNTFFSGSVQVFSGTLLPADDPRLEPRARKGRPADKKKKPPRRKGKRDKD